MARKAMVLKQQKQPKYSTQAYTRCKICGRPHAYLRKFGICRICFRELAYKGQTGVRKKLVKSSVSYKKRIDFFRYMIKFGLTKNPKEVK